MYWVSHVRAVWTHSAQATMPVLPGLLTFCTPCSTQTPWWGDVSNVLASLELMSCSLPLVASLWALAAKGSYSHLRNPGEDVKLNMNSLVVGSLTEKATAGQHIWSTLPYRHSLLHSHAHIKPWVQEPQGHTKNGLCNLMAKGSDFAVSWSQVRPQLCPLVPIWPWASHLFFSAWSACI